MFGIPEADVRVLAKLGIVPAERLGTMYLFDQEAVDILEELLADGQDDDADMDEDDLDEGDEIDD